LLDNMDVIYLILNLSANAVSLFIESFKFVAGQTLFWQSMGFTTGMGIFVGVILFNGNSAQAKKGSLAILSYAAMLLWTTTMRILPNAIEREFIYTDGRPFAGIATIFYITIFWILGIIIGVNVFRFRKDH